MFLVAGRPFQKKRGCEEKATISGPSPGSSYLPPDSWSWITDVLRWRRSIKKTQVSVLKVQRLKHHSFLLREAVETGCLSALPRLSTAGKPPTCRAGDQKRECRAAWVVVLLPCVAALRCCLVTLPFAAALCCCLLLLPFVASFCCFLLLLPFAAAFCCCVLLLPFVAAFCCCFSLLLLLRWYVTCAQNVPMACFHASIVCPFHASIVCPLCSTV